MLSALAAAVGSGGRARRYDGASVRAIATALSLAYEEHNGGTHPSCGGQCLPRGSAPDRGTGGEPCAVSPGRGRTARLPTRGGWERIGSRAPQAPRWTALYGYGLLRASPHRIRARARGLGRPGGGRARVWRVAGVHLAGAAGVGGPGGHRRTDQRERY